ncbi:hypothetical protein [Butyrivibrio sp. VCB2001]|uniref:hypothetical protein n=1 Tax=Butyrivibrio sp. VCB2001 TaxID=1280667 RepID=UPI00040CDD07|nr:hypothetical protein [Butyrivibrio sp. VCB2001]
MDKISGEKVTKNIYKCPDRKYRWIYELNMLKNPMIALTILKVLGIVFIAITIFELLIEVFDGDVSGWIKDFLLTPQFFILPGILLGLTLLGYFITAAVYGFKYIVLFEMNEEGIAHKQLPRQFKKAEALGWLAAMAGAAAGNMIAMGSGIMATSKDMSLSNFGLVKKVRKRKNFNAIELFEPMEHNQIYAESEDFDFVWDYISSRCKKAEIKY